MRDAMAPKLPMADKVMARQGSTSTRANFHAAQCVRKKWSLKQTRSCPQLRVIRQRNKNILIIFIYARSCKIMSDIETH